MITGKAMMTTKLKTAKTIDEAKAKRQEIRRLERRIEKLRREFLMQIEMNEEMREQLREANKLVKASPDAVGQVIRGAMELCKHYPLATSAALYIHQDRKDGRYIAACQIPIPLPEVAAEGK